MAVRNEAVRLTLDDAGYSTGMVKAAVATSTLEAALKSLDGTHVRTSVNVRENTKQVDEFGKALRKSNTDIDKFSGRVRIALDAFAMLGPGLVPIATIGVPALAGLASQLGIVALGAGATVLAFQGVGDALGALNEAHLNPTVANLEKAQAAMDLLAPQAQEFVVQLQAMRPAFAAVRDAGAETLFPRLSVALEDLSTVLPKAERLMGTFGRAVGQVGIMTADSLASGEWNSFINFLNREAEPTLTTLASTVGSLAHGLAEMWMAFDPLNDDFAGWLEQAAQGFEDWAAGLSETQGFADFVAYIRETGPQVADTFSAIANAVLQIAEAAAPLGGPVLHALEGIANVIAKVADSNIGTPLLIAISTFSALNSASALWGRTLEAATKRGATGIGKITNALGKLLAATLALEVAGQVLASLEERAAGAAPSVERLTKALLEGSEADFNAAFGGELGQVLDDLEPGITDLGAQLDALGESTGGLGDALVTGLAFATGLGPAMADAGVDAEKLKQAMDSLDGALANIAAEGGINMAKQKFDDLVEAQGLSGDQVATLMTALPMYSEALAAAGNSAAIATEKQRALASASSPLGDLLSGNADAAKDTADGYNQAADAASRMANALSDLAGWLDKREAIRGYEEAVRTLSKSLRNGFTLQDIENLDQVGRGILQVASQIESKALRKDFLREARAGLVEMANNAAPKAAAEIQKLINRLDQYGGLKPKPPKLDVDDKPVRGKVRSTEQLLQAWQRKEYKAALTGDPSDVAAAVAAAKRYLASVDGDVATTYIRVKNLGVQGAGPSRTDTSTGADGATVPKTGKPYADRHLYLLADGEEVISNRHGQADRYRADRAAGRIPGYADGGRVGIGTAASMTRGGWGSADFSTLLAQLHGLLSGVHGLSEKELAIRDRDIERTKKQLDKILDKREEMAKKEVEADKARLQAARDMQKQLEDQVAGLFKSDVFAPGDSKVYAVFPDGSRTELEGGLDALTADQANYFQQSGATYQTDSGAGDAAGALGGDISRIREALRLYKELRARGFDGPAFRDLVGTADVETLTAYAAMSRSQLHEIETLFNQRDRLANRAGEYAGQDYDQGIGKLESRLASSVAELRETKQEIKGLRQEVKHLTAVERKAPQLIGEEVGGVLTGAIRDGVTGRGRRG